MKTKLPSVSVRQRLLRGRLPLILALSMPVAAFGQATWKGGDNSGGDGAWQNTLFTKTPGSTDDVSFVTDDTYGALDTVVTIGDNVLTSGFRGLGVRNYVEDTLKTVTINLGAGAALRGGTAGVLNTGGAGAGLNPTVANSTILKISGPETGTATVSMGRIIQEGNTINGDKGTQHRNTTILEGAGLVVNLYGGYSAAGAQGAIIFDKGVTVNTHFASGTNSAGAFYVRPNAKATPGVFENWMTVRHATLSIHTLDVRGLFQLAEQGNLVATKKTTTSSDAELNILVGTTDNKTAARFEAAGSGIDATAKMTFYGQTTLAIGVSADPASTSGSVASTLTVNNDMSFNAGSNIEFELFGSGADDVDRLVIGSTGSLTSIGSGVRIVLKLNGYVLEGGESWQLIDTSSASADWLTGNINLGLIDLNIWDISAFNEAGGWTISAHAIPEPSTYAFLALSGLGALLMAKRRR